MSALVSQFPSVDQFRWVGWFNMALGVLSLVFLTLLFHGEWKSPCMTNAKVNEKDLVNQKKRWFEFFSKAGTFKIAVSTQNLIYEYNNYSVSSMTYVSFNLNLL